MAIKNNGVIEFGTKTSEVIKQLQQHVEMYGDTEFRIRTFELDHDELQCKFEHFKDACMLYVEEEF
jgi:chaperonin cofactor prefoldin